MSDLTEEFRREIAEAVEPEVQPAGPGHPDIDELIAYQLGQLSEERAPDLQEHFLRCSECVELLLDLNTFVTAAGAPPDAPSSFEAAAGWRSLWSRLRGPSRPAGWLLAASIAILAVGLSSWALLERKTASGLRFEVARLSLPQADVPIVDLYPASAERGPSDAPTPLVIPPGAAYLTAILALPEPPEVTRFEVEIEDGNGRTVWNGAVRISEHGTFRLGLPTRLFDGGDLLIHLLAVDGETRERIETYPLSVLRSADGSDHD
ncbi:MAG: anti-sigma factor family protein [Thermoanaerobaculia bacterium]